MLHIIRKAQLFREQEVVRFAQGMARWVVIIGPLAFKFARRGEDGRKTGRRCNLGEAERYRKENDANREMLCPVVACSPRGFLLIQRAVRPMTRIEFATAIEHDGFPKWDYTPGTKGDPIEEKRDSWGYFRGRLVAVDYSSHELMPDEEDD